MRCLKLAGSREKKRQPDHGRCVWQTGYRNGYPLHPPCPTESGWWMDLKDPKKVEMALWKIVPPEEGSDFCHRLVYHGRDVCTARTKPYCEKCCLEDICKKKGV